LFLNELLSGLGLLLRFVGGLVAATLPRPLWRRLEDRFPVSTMALGSALSTMGAGVLLGAHGFLSYTTPHASQLNEDFLRTPTRVWPAPFFSMFDLFIFALATPIGLFASYLSLSGFYRTLAAVTDDPRGDPLLSALHRRVTRTLEKRRLAQEEAEYARRAGPPVSDLLLTGQAARLAEAELVVVASRRKPGWERGVFVVTPDGWFRIGVPVERELHSGLRTLYPLTRIQDAEVARRMVAYQLPPLTPASLADSGSSGSGGPQGRGATSTSSR
jgi:hypothetical protein